MWSFGALSDFNSLVAHLLIVDVKIEVENRAILLFSSLPESYDHVITTILYGKDSLVINEVTITLYL